jgi:hypothetical protein
LRRAEIEVLGDAKPRLSTIQDETLVLAEETRKQTATNETDKSVNQEMHVPNVRRIQVNSYR